MSSDDIYNRQRGPWAKIQGILVGVLVALLVLAFAVWGIEDVFRPNSGNNIVKVGDAEVSQPEFMDRFNDRMQELAREQGEGLTNQQAWDRGIPQQLVQRLQSDLAIEADAGDLGIGVNNRDVRAYVEAIEAFRNPITGEFDETQLENLLRSNRISRAEFEDDIVRVLTQRQTLPAIMGGVRAPGSFAERYNTFVNEIRTGRLIRLDESVLDAVPEPTEEEIRSYIAANKSRFTNPEYRQVLMLRLDPQDFQGNDPADPRFADADAFPEEMFDVYASEEEVRERFDLLVSTGQIGSVETRDVLIFTVPTEEQANAIAARLSAGDSVAAVTADGDLDAPSRFEGLEPDGLINADASEAAFELEQGKAAVAPTGFGTFEVVYVERINDADVPDFAQERDRLTREVIAGKARERIGALEQIVEDGIYTNKSVEQIADEIDMPLQAYPLIDRTGTTPDGVRLNGFSRLPGIAQDPDLLNAIFAADIGFESDITPTVNNGLAVFRVIDIVDPAPKPFEEVRDVAAASLRNEAVDRLLVTMGRDVARRLEAGEDFDAVASQLGVDVQPLALQRATPPRTLSQSLLVSLFEGEPGDVARGPGAAPGTYEVAVLDSVSAGTERIGGRLLSQIQDNISEQIALDISSAYTTAILNEKDAQVYEDQLRAALSLDDPAP